MQAIEAMLKLLGLITTPITISDQAWNMDFGAIDHVILDSNRLDNKVGHEGRQQLRVRNGESLNISYIHSSLLPITLLTKCLYLKHVFCVKNNIKNCLGISKLTMDNDVVIEFNSVFCFIEDKDTSVILLKRIIKDGYTCYNQVEGGL